MNNEQFKKLAMRTEAYDFPTIQERFNSNPALAVALMGTLENISTAIEHLDQLKKHIFYGKETDFLDEFAENRDYVAYVTKEHLKNAPILAPNSKMIRILHGIVGIATESGELIDALAPHLLGDKPIDAVNIQEEIFDCAWYQAILADSLGINLDETHHRGFDKLKSRYPEKFTEQNAINRNLETERRILETGEGLNGQA